MRIDSTTTASTARPVNDKLDLEKHYGNPESLKKTLQDPKASLPDTMQALGHLYLLDAKKAADGDASEEEKNRLRLNEAVRSGQSSESDRAQLASLLGMSAERMEEVHKQFGVSAEPTEKDHNELIG